MVCRDCDGGHDRVDDPRSIDETREFGVRLVGYTGVGSFHISEVGGVLVVFRGVAARGFWWCSVVFAGVWWVWLVVFRGVSGGVWRLVGGSPRWSRVSLGRLSFFFRGTCPLARLALPHT
jgi:hypothetical protein